MDAQQILAQARAKEAARAAATPRIDYDAAAAMVKRQRAALTRAKKKGRDAVIVACRNAVREWNQPGMFWPDDWSAWQRALDDVLPWHDRIELGSLDG